MLRRIIHGYRVKGTEVYFVGLVDHVKAVFTRAKIWELLGEDDHTCAGLENCMRLIHQRGGNLDEAKRRAEAEGRDIDAEMRRWDLLR